MRQMSAQAERSRVGQGEALSDPGSDEARARDMKRRAQGQDCCKRFWQERTCNRHGNGCGPTRARPVSTVWTSTRRRTASQRVARNPGTTVVWHVPATAGASGNDPEAGWRRARAWHPDGDGSAHPAGAACRCCSRSLIQRSASTATASGRAKVHMEAVHAAQAYVQSGRRVVVDVDLEKFFDRVNHDILIDRFRNGSETPE
jgi:hypothetical protein